MNDLLSELNPAQREAVLHTEGPLLILAGAGSGKTRVITYRIAHLIETHRVHPAQILAVTFTNKAAGEMKDRVERLLGPAGRGVWVSTFHSACVRILRTHAERLSYPREFVIYDAGDQAALVRDCARSLGINEDVYKPQAIARRISDLKNALTTPEAFRGTAQTFGMDDAVARTYLLYQDRLAQAGAWDFDDLLMQTVRLFERAPDVLAAYHRQFRYLLIDEYQDTNHAQYRFVRLLAGERANVCVVGDDDQSIYAFRGADVRNILEFEKDFPNAATVTLEQNYRSTQAILDAASAVVERNPSRKPKRLWTDRLGGEKITVARLPDDETEADYLCRTLREHVRAGKTYRDFAVLYRTNAQSRALEERLRNEAIPYVIVGGLRFYERKEIKDAVAYLRAIVNPADTMSLKRIINVPTRGIGATALERIDAYATQAGVPWAEALRAVAADPERLVAGSRRAIERFLTLMEGLRETAKSAALPALLTAVLERTRYVESLREEFGADAESRIENIQELFSAVEEFEEQYANQATGEPGPPGEDAVPRLSPLAAFLDRVALVSDTDALTSTDGAVPLMTLHSAKGLEFPVVFLVGVEEGLFPHSRSLNDPDAMEEERRLCYVGITRAKERLYVTYTGLRRLYGSVQFNAPSRFIEEIPEDLKREIGVQEPAATGAGRAWESPGRGVSRTGALPGARAPERAALLRHPEGAERLTGAPSAHGGFNPYNQEPPEAAEGSAFAIGARVRHPVWGAGTIQASEGVGEDAKVVVAFRAAGTKKLAVKFARLEPA
ncbi:MAG TPA: UvrD-helicase domain-containing protein [Nitrospiria bacterium]|nr:UvrD-helicase domain-containing protein [Nitrospiria bacterium]